MRKNKNLCPNCKATIEPGWRFCLACGEVLIEDVVEVPHDPTVLTSAQEKAYKKGKVKCWQCNGPLKAPSPACPSCGADLLNFREKTARPVAADPEGTLHHLPMPLLLMFALMGIVVIGGLGYLMSGGSNSSSASDGEGFKLPSLPEISLGSLFGDDKGSAAVPDGIVPSALEGRAISVADDGLIVVRVDGKDVDVRLAGVSDDFVNDCQGSKALARVQRILTEGSVIYVHLDSVAKLVTTAGADPQSVYIWQFDRETEKVRFVNAELIASGEAALQSTELTDQPPAPELVAASARAEDKERGRFEPGACP